MKKRIILYADTDKVLTNGEIYGTQIFLADGEDPATYQEITKEKYNEILEEREAKVP